MKIRLLIISICIGLIAGIAFAEDWLIDYGNVSDPVRLQTLLENRMGGLTGSKLTFPSGASGNNQYISGATARAFKLNDGYTTAEDLTLTFSSNAAALTSSTGVVTFGFGAVIPSANYMLFTPGSTPAAVKGNVYYDSTADALMYRTNSGWVTAGSGTFTGGSITSDCELADGVDLTSTTDANEAATIKVYDVDATTYRNVLSWTNANTPAIVLGAAQNTLAIASSGGLNVSTGGAVTGVSTFTATGALQGTQVTLTGSGGLILESGGTLTNGVDSEFKLTDGGEDISIDMDSASNVIGLKSGSGVNGIYFGDIDDLSGIGTIAFDAAAASIGTATTGAGQDLTIGITGATDSSIILASSGTGADAIQIVASAGGIDITANGAAAGEDIDITTSASINLSSTEDAANAIKLLTNGGTSETIVATNTQGTGAGAITLTATAGGVDIDAAATKDIDLSGGQVLITSKDDAASAIGLTTNVGTSETIVIHNTKGTGADSLNIDCDAGGIDIDCAAGKIIDIDGGTIQIDNKTAGAAGIALTMNQGATDTMVLTNTQGTGTGALTFAATAGGIDMDAAAGKIVDIAGGDVKIASKSNSATAISLTTNAGAAEKITITNTKGTDAAALGLVVTAGGIDIDCAAGKIIDIDGGTIQIDSKTAGAGAIALTANQGATDTITVTNTKGTEATAITLTATAGGITLTSNAGVSTGDPISGDGTAALGGFLKTVTNDADGKTLTIAESGTVQTNAGAVGAAAWTLPGAAPGLEYIFVVMAAQQLRVTPAAGDVIYINAVGADAAEYWCADAIGESVHLIAVDATNWIAISHIGTWTQQTP